jgi:hypothetical protein
MEGRLSGVLTDVLSFLFFSFLFTGVRGGVLGVGVKYWDKQGA